MTYKLSILIPARNEVYGEIDLLAETVENVLANTSEQCELVVVLDGYQPPEPHRLNHPRVTVIHHSKSIGQRAACNEAARVATGEWVCKLDAHCAVGPEFDTKLLEGMQPDWTVVPGQFNLHVSDWKCKKCQWTQDHGVKPERCPKCKSKFIKQVKVWQPRDGNEGRRRTYTHSWYFDTTLTFGYWGEYAADEEYCNRHKIQFRPETQAVVHDTMCLLGACWAIKRDRYFDLNICDESLGSWGQQGVEVACKSWLSGGRLVVNQATWFAHFFRVGGINFPYPDGGRKERAVAKSKALWLQNAWPKQVRPLSWLVERFWPTKDWSVEGNEVWKLVKAAGEQFNSLVSGSTPNLITNRTLPHQLPANDGSRGQKVPADTVGLSSVDGSGRIAATEVNGVGNQIEMNGIATSAVSAEMVEGRDGSISTDRQRLNQPSVNNAMNQGFPLSVSGSAVSGVVQSSTPIPAGAGNFDLRKQSNDVLEVQGNGEILLSSHDSASSAELRSGSELRFGRDSGSPIVPRKGILYYTCLSHDLTLELAARENLRRAANGHEVGCVSLNQRTDFGDWNVVVQREKSGTTMHYQILAGLERSRADYMFLCESDVIYHRSHFDFTPPRDDTFYYNTNVWRIRYADGHAVRTEGLQQVSGICASRKLLLGHYRRRIQFIEANGGQFDVKRMAYEPGTRGNFDNSKVANWESEYPNIDITGHGQTLTKPKFSVDEFRNKRYAAGWQETDDALPGWPQLSNGGLQRLLEELANGIHT